MLARITKHIAKNLRLTPRMTFSVKDFKEPHNDLKDEAEEKSIADPLEEVNDVNKDRGYGDRHFNQRDGTNYQRRGYNRRSYNPVEGEEAEGEAENKEEGFQRRGQGGEFNNYRRNWGDRQRNYDFQGEGQRGNYGYQRRDNYNNGYQRRDNYNGGYNNENRYQKRENSAEDETVAKENTGFEENRFQRRNNNYQNNRSFRNDDLNSEDGRYQRRDYNNFEGRRPWQNRQNERRNWVDRKSQTGENSLEDQFENPELKNIKMSEDKSNDDNNDKTK